MSIHQKWHANNQNCEIPFSPKFAELKNESQVHIAEDTGKKAHTFIASVRVSKRSLLGDNSMYIR